MNPASPVIDAAPARVVAEPTKPIGHELWQAILVFKKEFVLVGLLSALANLLMLTPTLYMLQVYDRVMVSQNALTLVSVSLITLLMFGVIALAEWGRTRILVEAGVRFDRSLSTRVFNASFESNLSRTGGAQHRPGRAFADLLQVRQFLTGNGIFAFFDLPWVPIYLVVMFILHPMLGWLSVVFAIVQGGLAWLGHRRAVAPAEQAQQALLETQTYVQGKLRNVEVIESMGMVGNLRRHWQARHDAWNERQEESQHLNHRITAISKFVRYCQQSASLGAGALLVIDGELTPGAMIAANVLMTRALAPIDMLVSTWRSFIVAREAFVRLGQLLEAHPDRGPQAKRVAPKGALDLIGVSAVVPAQNGAPERSILKGIDLSVQPGTVLVVMGPSGSGKSTLARVILGLWGDVRGQVRLDGQPIDSWDRHDLGPHLGYLPQDIELFEGTIAENIARFSEVDPQSVIQAAQAAGLHDMILRFPKGYDTPMGEAGSLLSGGQRQRVALARALYGQPALLVLDEPNANLDEAGEAALARAVADLKRQGRTVVLISHRPSALAVADRLLILRDGQIQIEGPRDAVLARLRAGITAQPQNPFA